jgi:hypothetical protein
MAAGSGGSVRRFRGGQDRKQFPRRHRRSFRNGQGNNLPVGRRFDRNGFHIDSHFSQHLSAADLIPHGNPPRQQRSLFHRFMPVRHANLYTHRHLSRR